MRGPHAWVQVLQPIIYKRRKKKAERRAKDRSTIKKSRGMGARGRESVLTTAYSWMQAVTKPKASNGSFPSPIILTAPISPHPLLLFSSLCFIEQESLAIKKEKPYLPMEVQRWCRRRCHRTIPDHHRVPEAVRQPACK